MRQFTKSGREDNPGRCLVKEFFGNFNKNVGLHENILSSFLSISHTDPCPHAWAGKNIEHKGPVKGLEKNSCKSVRWISEYTDRIKS